MDTYFLKVNRVEVQKIDPPAEATLKVR